MFANQQNGTDKRSSPSSDAIRKISKVAIADRGRLVIKMPVGAYAAGTTVPILQSHVEDESIKGLFSKAMVPATGATGVIKLPVGKVYRVRASITANEDVSLMLSKQTSASSSVAAVERHKSKATDTYGSDIVEIIDSTDASVYPVTGANAIHHLEVSFQLGSAVAVGISYPCVIQIEELASY